MSDHYCAAPFNSVRVVATNNTQSEYRPCCMYQSNTSYTNILQYVNSQELADLREHFLTKSFLPAGCRPCADQEQQKLTSWRNHFNAKFQKQKQITQLELFPSNVCNLKCFMCSDKFSTALGAERTKLNLIPSYQEIDNVDACLDSIQSLPALTNVSFLGGEFFLTKKNLEILDLVIQRKLSIRVVTNATILLAEHMARLSQIPNLELQISLDGIGSSYEFMRYPAQWPVVEQNIHRIKTQLKHAKINFNFVVQPLNVQHMIPTMDYANKLHIPIRLTNLVEPDWLTWKILDDQEKTKLITVIASQLDTHRLSSKQRQEVMSYQQTIQTTPMSILTRQTFRRRIKDTLQLRDISREKTLEHLDQIHSLLE